ncbi:hypothetical protein KQUDLBSD_CDS0173 [Staphylococcus phage PG-2021_40]
MNTEKFDALMRHIFENGTKERFGSEGKLIIEHNETIFELSLANTVIFSLKLYIPELDREEIIGRFDDSKFDTIEDMLETYYTIMKGDKEREENKEGRKQRVLNNFLGNVKIK